MVSETNAQRFLHVSQKDRVMAKPARAPQCWSMWKHLAWCLLKILKERWEPGILARGLHSDLTSVACRCRRPTAVASPILRTERYLSLLPALHLSRSQAVLVRDPVLQSTQITGRYLSIPRSMALNRNFLVSSAQCLRAGV